MTSVLETTTTGKAPRAYYCHLYDVSGALTKVGGTLYFVTDDAIVEIEPSMLNFLTVLGEMTLSNAQRIADLLHGGAARIACSRHEGVA
jgi:hypothetical protein